MLEVISEDYVKTAKAKGLFSSGSSGAIRSATPSSP